MYKTTTMPHHDDSHKHDECDESGYKKRCHCQKCKRQYDDWCKKNKKDGCTTCKRKCYTVCEIKCERPTTSVLHWGYKKEYEGKWEKYEHHGPVPHADKAHKKHKKCDDDKSESKSKSD